MAAPTLEQPDIIRLPGGTHAVLRSEPAKALMRLVQRVASTPAAVLIQGETGSGKELIARTLHQFSSRHDKPWIDINCAVLPEHLIESELFGHEKGAFSGADAVKAGLFELAHGGTLFLDEIGELDLRVQGKLLRVLDGQPYYRLGGTKKIPVDVRIIAATNHDLNAASKNGKFRADLYFRLSQIQLFVPPLRDRLGDLEEIALQFLEASRPGTKLSPEALRVLCSYPWPGNIRELKNVIVSTAVMLEEGCKLILPEHLPQDFLPKASSASIARADSDGLASGDLDSMERLMVERALKENHGDQVASAEALGISRRTLSRKIKAYQLEEIAARGGAIGILNIEQYRYFRAAMDQPLLIRSANGDESSVKSVNLSSSGVGIRGFTDPQRFSGIVDLEFCLAESQPKMSLKGKVTWADSQGNAGVRFVSLPRTSQQLIDDWIAKKRSEEGWTQSPRA